MRQVTSPLNPTVLASFESLKRTVRCEYDIALWFREHLSLIDPHYGDVSREIHVNLTADDVMDSICFPEHASLRCFRVTMMRYEYPAPLTPLMTALGGRNVLGGMEKWLFPIDPFEWSFLVADLAVKFVMKDSWGQYPDDARVRAEQILDHALPAHFPGLTPPLLYTLFDTGLIEEHDFLKMRDKLFELRPAQASDIALPSDLTHLP